MPLAVAAGALILLALAASAALALYDFNDGPASGLREAPSDSTFHASESGLVDSDRSGIPDALQNFLYGTDPNKWNTSGTPLPDGWLIKYGLDALDPTIDRQPAAAPPAEALPPAYVNQWPARFVPTLWEVYSHARPINWSEAVDGPYDNGLDPTKFDNNEDGIPDGWLLAYGLDPLDANLTSAKLAGDQGLTVLEAFEHNTDPRELDSDGDGLTDRDEITGPANPNGSPSRFSPTDPALYSTTGSGVCDGYLVANGLDPSDPANAYGDLARSGATTKQKFVWSLDRFGAAACTQGLGLDPTGQSTTGGPIPDGWLLRYGLDPLDANVAEQHTETSLEQNGPWDGRSEPPQGRDTLEPVVLTVLDEYLVGRPSNWDEEIQGPWWGGTDPTKTDTDGDGLPDAVELRGFFINVTTDVGPGAVPQHNLVHSDPVRANTDGDGLTDYAEIVDHGTDPTKRDTDVDGILDHEELADIYGLDPMRADSAGDFLRDGQRLALLRERAQQYAADPEYHFPGPPNTQRFVTDWVCTAAGAKEAVGDLENADCAELLTPQDLAGLLGPTGNLNGRVDEDGDPVPNILDSDIDGDGLLNGWELHPRHYERLPQFDPTPFPRSQTDPLNDDTDGDGLKDKWEVDKGLALHDKQRYSLDPGRWSTLCDVGGDCRSDAEQDPDEDSAFWPVVEQGTGGKVLRLSTYDFPNLMEQQFDLEPHAFSTSDDGLGDGWKTFWSVTYPTLLASESDRASLGTHRPPGDEIPAAAARPAAGSKQAHTIIKEGQITRFAVEEPIPRPGEVVERFEDIPLDDGSVGTLFRITTPVNFTFADAHTAGTNPYLASTVGDGIPDWWKWHYRELSADVPEWADCIDGLDILDPNLAGKRLTGSGLTVRQEYENGTNPLCTSTMYIPIADSVMASLGDGAALDPENARFFLEQQVDTDGDGLFDFEEIIGQTYEHLGSHRIQTDPKDPDTDGDGLLDGENVVLHVGDDDTWIQFYTDLGISYRRIGDEVTFKGEITHQAHPRNPDDAGIDVPAGWLVSNGVSLTSTGQPGYYMARYSYGMPAWWDEQVHGPWWGGLPGSTSSSLLQQFEADPDRDLDGLDDIDARGDPYEDPMPGANRDNAWHEPAWQAYPDFFAGQQADTAALDDSGQGRAVHALLAQHYVFPRQAGNQYVSFADRQELDAPAAVQPCIEDVELRGADGAPVTKFVKGTLTYVHGTLTDECRAQSIAGLEGITVEARFGSPGQTFGAAFTDALGHFAIPVNITSGQSVEVPETGPALVLRGQTEGVVNWTADPSVVEPGPRFLTIQTYAASGHAPHRDAVAAFSQFPQYRVDAGSVLTLNFPEAVVSGSVFEVEYRLVDSGGAPLGDKVIVTWTDGEHASTPDLTGRGSVFLTAEHDQNGPQAILARSVPDDEYVTLAQAEAQLIVRNPVLVDLEEPPARLDAGQTLDIEGIVHFQNKGVAGASVQLNLTGPRDVSGQIITSEKDGTFSISLSISEDHPYGEYVLVAKALETETAVERENSKVLDIRSIPRFTDVSTSNITQGHAATVAGVLREPDSRPLADAKVRIRLHDTATEVTTDGLGRFEAQVTTALPAYPVAQVIEFDGDEDHTPVRHRAERAVLAPTNLTVASGELARGAALELPVHLTDGDGSPIQGAAIRVTWGDEETGLAITNASGIAVFMRAGDPQDAIGSVAVKAEYPGSRDGGHMASVAAAQWTVITQAEFVLPKGAYEAGTQIPQAILRDAGTLEPLADAPVTYTVSRQHVGANATLPGNTTGQEPRHVLTDDKGRFTVLEGINRTTSPTRFDITSHFVGNASYGPITETSAVDIRTPVTLDIDAPERIVMGRETLITATIEGLDGQAVDSGHVNATLDGASIGSADVGAGLARLTILVPENTKPGMAELEFQFEGSQQYAPSHATANAQILRPVTLAIEVEEALPGDTTKVHVTALAGGQPVPFAPIHLEIQGMEGGLRGTTDANGVATFHLQQPVGERLMAARFTGGGDLNPAHTTATLEPATPTSRLENGTNALAWVAATLAVVLAALAGVAYRLRRSPLEPIMRRARRILGERGEHAKRILEAYQQVEETAIGQGILLETAQTARVLQGAVEAHVPAQAHASLDRLMGLFEMARYGEQEMHEGHRKQAIESVDAIVAAMRRDAGLSWPRLGRRAPA